MPPFPAAPPVPPPAGPPAPAPPRRWRARVARPARSGVRLLAGALLGALTVPLDVAYLVGYGLLLPLRRRNRPAGHPVPAERYDALARPLVELHRRRLAGLLGAEVPGGYDLPRARRYLALRWLVGLLGGFLLLLFAWGLTSGLVWAWDLCTGRSTLSDVAQQLVGSVLLGFLIIQGFAGWGGLDRRLARRLLGPGDRELLRRRIAELAASRAGVVAAVDAERRRIERDLHDGVQQRLVAMGMLLGRARRTADPARAAELLRQAHEQSGQILDELREVAWRVYPTALDNLGLGDALARVAEHAGLPVRLDCRLPDRPPGAVETAAYFVVSEAVTNAAKHARASQVTVEVGARDGLLVVSVRDDGIGGADPAGSGLAGLARRVAALDGEFRVVSPPGGPTTLTAELPCA
ncbi:sensor histidine kinase [Micromonospora sp. NPDC049559]|uniref:sensor histidine kinase n=1 Tax=Micromonospora sp. NPDC049559 TaxID=3155923 RepID=UPI0034179541